jgi:phosphoglycolate phosphatase
MHKTRAVVFDLDGTLLATLSDIAAAANAALTEYGFPTHPESAYRVYLGDGLRNLARKVLPEDHRSEEQIDRIVARYREVYAETWDRTSKPFPGVMELLAELSRRDMMLGVLSNKRDDFTKLCVERLLPGVRFEVVRGEVLGTPLKPDPTSLEEVMKKLGVGRQECLYVGDSEIDVETASRAGVRCAVVTWGFRDRSDLQSAGATIFVDCPEQILAHI